MSETSEMDEISTKIGKTGLRDFEEIFSPKNGVCETSAHAWLVSYYSGPTQSHIFLFSASSCPKPSKEPQGPVKSTG